jgi:uncharacterized protein
MTNNSDKSLIEYPCDFPIKVMGKNSPDLKSAVIHICKQFDPKFDMDTIEERSSKENKYIGLTVLIHATSRAQLDEVYRTLSTHPLVSVVL